MAVLRRDEDKSQSGVKIHDVHTILGPESTFEGKLIFEGTVRIDGNFKGEIQTSNILIVGQGARVEAKILVGKIVVNGEVVGDISAKEAVELNAPAIPLSEDITKNNFFLISLVSKIGSKDLSISGIKWLIISSIALVYGLAFSIFSLAVSIINSISSSIFKILVERNKTL